MEKKLDLRGVRPPPRHFLRGRMTFSQQAKKIPEPLPHPYTGARRLPIEKKLQKKVERWQGPEQDWVKVNTDAASTVDVGSGSSGAVIRNHGPIW